MCEREDERLHYEIISLFKTLCNLCQLTPENPWLSLYNS